MTDSFKDLNKLLDNINQQTEKLIAAANKLAEIDKPHTAQGNANPNEQAINQFKQVELLAHELAYTLNSDIKVVDVIDEDGIARNYRVQQIDSGHDGLVSFILVGSEATNPRIHVLFRGTHNLASVQRDLEYAGFGPGSRIFAQKKHHIMTAINKAVEHKQHSCKEPINLSIAGHSLGGSDAQNCITAVLEEIANSNPNHPKPLAKVGKINLLLANSAGVTSIANQKCRNALKIMANRNSPIAIEQHVILVGGDGIQQGGYTSALPNDPTNRVHTKLLKVDIGKEGRFANLALVMQGKIAVLEGLKGTFEAHTTRVFSDSKTVDVKYKLYDSADPEDAKKIENSLKNKVYRKVYKSILPLQVFKKIAKSVMDFGASIMPQPKNKNKK